MWLFDIFRETMTLLISLGMHLFFAICLMVIAQRTNTPNGWLAFLPIGNLYLLTQIAGRPGWWTFLFLIPGVNVVILAILCMEVAEERGKSPLLGLLVFVPLVNLYVAGLLAFGE